MQSFPNKKCLKNKGDVIKMMRRGEEKWERKPLKKRWIIPHFHDVTWLIFKTLVKLPDNQLFLILRKLKCGNYKIVLVIWSRHS